jgi:hypothetical protein
MSRREYVFSPTVLATMTTEEIEDEWLDMDQPHVQKLVKKHGKPAEQVSHVDKEAKPT